MYPTIVLYSDPGGVLSLKEDFYARLLSCHLTPIVPGYKIREHEHSHWELSFIVDGMMTSCCDGKKICCREDSDTVFIMPPGVIHSRVFGSEKQNCNMSLNFLLSKNPGDEDPADICRRKNYEWKPEGFSCSLLQQLRKEVGNYSCNNVLPHLIQSFLLLFIRDFFDLKSQTAVLQKHNMWKYESGVSRAEDIYYFLVDHVSRPGVAKDLTERFGLSLRQLNRIFQAKYGVSLKKALEQLRLKEACQLLTTTALDNHEIAGILGFAASGSFYSFFKRHLGCSPGEYRRENMKKSHY